MVGGPIHAIELSSFLLVRNCGAKALLPKSNDEEIAFRLAAQCLKKVAELKLEADNTLQGMHCATHFWSYNIAPCMSCTLRFKMNNIISISFC